MTLDLLAWAPSDRVSVARENRGKPTIDERFAHFHAANPHVLDEMLELARARLDRGETRIGAKALYEELRQSLRVRKFGEWKLNNDFTATYARKLIEAEPRLEGMIELRRRKST